MFAKTAAIAVAKNKTLIPFDTIPYGENVKTRLSDVTAAYKALHGKVMCTKFFNLIASYGLVCAKSEIDGYFPGGDSRPRGIFFTNKWPLAVIHELGHYLIASDDERGDAHFKVDLIKSNNQWFSSLDDLMIEVRARYTDLCLMALLCIKKKWRKHHLLDIQFVWPPGWDAFKKEILNLVAKDWKPPAAAINQDHIRQTNHLICSVLGSQ